MHNSNAPQCWVTKCIILILFKIEVILLWVCVFINKNIRGLFVIISEWHWKNTINDHLEHHALHRVAQNIFFPFISGKYSFLKTDGVFSEKNLLLSWKKKKKKRNRRFWFRKSGNSKIKLFHVSNWLQYFISGCQAEICVRSHKNYSTISSTHHSLHCSLSLNSLFCDALLSCHSETVLQRSYKLMLDYKPQREGQQKSLETRYLGSTGITGTFTAYWSEWAEPRKSILVLNSNSFLMFQIGVHDNIFFSFVQRFFKIFV